MRATTWPGLARSQVVADFNGDGISDLATANNNLTGTVSVALGNGDGTLQSNVTYIVGQYPVDIVVGDFNHDGTNDLATANFENNLSHKVSVLLGMGGGAFHSNVFYGTAATPFQLAVIDFNNDGNPDLMTVSTTHYEVLYGNGDGTFQPATTVAPASSQQFAVSDFNGDGTNDVVAAIGTSDEETTVQVLFNDGGGGLVAGTVFGAGGTNPYHVVVSDFNLDGNPDVVVANHDSHNLAVLLGQGADQFQASVIYPTGQQPVRIAAGDFNGDGTNDLVVADESVYTLTLLLNQGGSSFLAPVTYEASGSDIGFGDFNSDGIIDLIASAGGLDAYPNVSLLLGNGDGTFQQAPRYATGRGPKLPVAADFNGDGKLDLAVPNSSSNTVSVLLNNGDGTFAANVDYFTGAGPSSVAVGDFNEDNKLDLVVANLNTNHVSLLLGNGSGTFQPGVIAASLFMLGAGFVVTGDFNHDNNLDFAIPNFAGLKVFPGNGNGTFGAEITSSDVLYTSSGATGFLNGDTNLDIVVVNGNTNFITVFLGNANGTFQPPLTNVVGTVIGGVAIGDLDDDGKLDIAAANIGCNPCSGGYYNGEVQVLLGNGNGTFQPPVGYPVDPSTATTSVAIGDVNGDGKPDLVATSRIVSRAVWVLLNNGDGTFQRGFPFNLGAGPNYLATADVDDDGRLDILASNQNIDTISVLINTCLFDVGNPTNNADLAISKLDSPDPVGVGNNLTYTVTVTNKGPAAATSVTLTDTLPGSAAFVSASAGCINNGGTVTCALGDLGNGQSTSIHIIVAPNAAGSITNSASVVADEADSVPANNTATAVTTVTVPACADLTGAFVSVAPKCKTKADVTTCSLKGSMSVQNLGTITSPETVLRFFLSADMAFDGGDLLLVESPVKAVSTSKLGKAKLKAKLAAGVNVSGQFLIAVIDAGNASVECSEANNVIVFGPLP